MTEFNITATYCRGLVVAGAILVFLAIFAYDVGKRVDSDWWEVIVGAEPVNMVVVLIIGVVAILLGAGLYYWKGRFEP